MTPEIYPVFEGKALNINNITKFSSEFPLGEGWLALHLVVALAFTVGTGATALSEGELQIIQNVYAATDREVIVPGAPARTLYRMNQLCSPGGFAPVKTAIAASDGTYYVPFSIFFSDPLLRADQRDLTILDTSRNKAFFLNLQMGGVAQLLSTVGTSAVTATLSAYLERYPGPLPASMKPKLASYFNVMQPVVPSSQTYIDLERSGRIGYKRLQIYETTGSTAGSPHTGTASAAIISTLDVKTSRGFQLQPAARDSLQRQNINMFGLGGSIPTGVTTVSFVDQDKTIARYLDSNQATLRAEWVNQGSLPATPQVTVAGWGMQNLG